MFNLQYLLQFKTYVLYKIFDNKVIITNNIIKKTSKKKIKKFIVKKSSFKYNKSQEQYGLVYGNISYILSNKSIICSKLFEGIFFKSLNESNIIVINIKKLEQFLNNNK